MCRQTAWNNSRKFFYCGCLLGYIGLHSMLLYSKSHCKCIFLHFSLNLVRKHIFGVPLRVFYVFKLKLKLIASNVRLWKKIRKCGIIYTPGPAKFACEKNGVSRNLEIFTKIGVLD